MKLQGEIGKWHLFEVNGIIGGAWRRNFLTKIALDIKGVLPLVTRKKVKVLKVKGGIWPMLLRGDVIVERKKKGMEEEGEGGIFLSEKQVMELISTKAEVGAWYTLRVLFGISELLRMDIAGWEAIDFRVEKGSKSGEWIIRLKG